MIAASNFVLSTASWYMAGINNLASFLTSVLSLSLFISLATYLYFDKDYSDKGGCAPRPLHAVQEEKVPVQLSLPKMPRGADKMTIKRTIRTEEIVVNNDNLGAAGDGACDNYKTSLSNNPNTSVELPNKKAEVDARTIRPQQNSVNRAAHDETEVWDRGAIDKDNNNNDATLYRTLEDINKKKYSPSPTSSDSFTDEQLLPVHEISTSAPTILNELPITEIPVKQLDVSFDTAEKQKVGPYQTARAPSPIMPQFPTIIPTEKNKHYEEGVNLPKVPRPQEAMVPFEPTVDLMFKLEDARYRYEPEKYPVAFIMEDARFIGKDETMTYEQNAAVCTNEASPNNPYDQQPAGIMHAFPETSDYGEIKRLEIDPCNMDNRLTIGEASKILVSRFKSITTERLRSFNMPSWLIQMCVAALLILAVSLIQTDVLPLMTGATETSENCVTDGSCTVGAGFVFGLVLTVIALMYMYFTLN